MNNTRTYTPSIFVLFLCKELLQCIASLHATYYYMMYALLLPRLCIRYIIITRAHTRKPNTCILLFCKAAYIANLHMHVA